MKNNFSALHEFLLNERESNDKHSFENYVNEKYLSDNSGLIFKIELPHKQLRHMIPTTIYMPHNKHNDEIKDVVLALHGLGSSQDSEVIKVLAKKLNDTGKALVSFDFMLHGQSQSTWDSFSLINSIADSHVVIDHISQILPNAKISLFGSSFGAYVALLLANDTLFDFKNITLRCPAVNMSETFERVLLLPNNMNMNKFIITKQIEFGFTKKIKLTYNFFNECKLLNLKQVFTNDNKYIINIVHGQDDEIVLLKDVLTFKELHPDNIFIDTVKDAGHRFNTPETFDEMLTYCFNSLNK